MEIKIRLYKSEILKAAKDETYLSGRANIAADGSNSEAVYHMQAGGEEVHEEKLMRSLRAGLEQLKAEFSKYVKNDGASTGDNIVDTLTEVDDYFDIVMNVSERFNKAYTDVLAGLSSAYLSSYVIASWWMAVTPALAKNYFDDAAVHLGGIKRSFVKVAPAAPAYKYPTRINCLVEKEDFSEGVEVSMAYTCDGVDDVLIESTNPLYVSVGGTRGNYTATLLRPIATGEKVVVALYSRHNPDVKYEIVWQ